MKERWVIMCGGFQGSRWFDSEEDAKQAAESMTMLSGKKWTVRKILAC